MGERLKIGAMDPRTEAEHIARYEYAVAFTKDKRVIDAACGTGYGTEMIAKGGAIDVTGVDVSDEAIATASSKYGHPKIKFQVLNVEELSTLGSGIADTVISFETIEHVADDRKFLKSVYEVLKPGGTFIVSTPERKCAGVKERLTKIPGNPFHRREYTRGEFVNLLNEQFVVDEILGQSQLAKFLTFLPVTICVKLGLRIFSLFGIHRFRNLYWEGTGPALVREDLCHGTPRFWVIRCHK